MLIQIRIALPFRVFRVHAVDDSSGVPLWMFSSAIAAGQRPPCALWVLSDPAHPEHQSLTSRRATEALLPSRQPNDGQQPR